MTIRPAKGAQHAIEMKDRSSPLNYSYSAQLLQAKKTPGPAPQ
jgi:hypothetical protein